MIERAGERSGVEQDAGPSSAENMMSFLFDTLTPIPGHSLTGACAGLNLTLQLLLLTCKFGVDPFCRAGS